MLIPAAKARPAPELQTSRWLNTPQALSLAALRGKVVALHAFQMLCPGCVQFGLPLAQRMAQEFDPAKVAVVGLHTVFEHHAVMGSAALEVFAHEYRLRFPIGIDQASKQGKLPLTMQAYALQGTPSLVLIDHHGLLRMHSFGQCSELAIGAAIGMLLAETLAV